MIYGPFFLCWPVYPLFNGVVKQEDEKKIPVTKPLRIELFIMNVMVDTEAVVDFEGEDA